ncbi:MAG: substrate-binding domain-containing protein [Desulfobacteraceae bacterium]|nr:substrate-binding domain-containing protein [Desulfobacteraceae bacterium]
MNKVTQIMRICVQVFVIIVLSAMWTFMIAGCLEAEKNNTSAFTKAAAVRASKPLEPDKEDTAVLYTDMVRSLGPTPEPRKRYRLGVILKYLGNPYYQLMADGMYDKAAELEVFIEFQAGLTESDQEGQLAVMETALAKEHDVLLVTPQTDNNLKAAVSIAREKGVLLINVGAALLDVADFYIGPNHRQSGALAAGFFVEHFGQGAELAVINGLSEDFGANRRLLGFEQALKSKAFKIVARPVCLWDLHIAFVTVQDLLTEHSNLRGIFCNNDTMALGAAMAVEQSDRLGQVLIVGTDGIKQAFEAILAGKMAATVDTSPFEVGRAAVDMAIRVLEGQPVNRVVYTQQNLVTKKQLPFE